MNIHLIIKYIKKIIIKTINFKIGFKFYIYFYKKKKILQIKNIDFKTIYQGFRYLK